MPRLRTFLPIACFALAACLHRHGAGPTPVPREWSLTIQNHHWLDVEVSVVHGGQTTRVGLITAATSQSFVLPTHLLGTGGDIRLVAKPIGSGQTVFTPLFTIVGGQSVEWTLERSLSTSSLSVH